MTWWWARPAAATASDVVLHSAAGTGSSGGATIAAPAGTAGMFGVFVAGYYTTVAPNFINPTMTATDTTSSNGRGGAAGGRILGASDSQSVDVSVFHMLCLAFQNANAILSNDFGFADGAFSFAFPALTAPHDGCVALNIVMCSSGNSDPWTHTGTGATEIASLARSASPARRAWVSPPLASGQSWGGTASGVAETEFLLTYQAMIGRT